MRKFAVVFSLVAMVFLLLAACSKKKEEGSEMESLENIKGVWEGSINIPNQPLPITVEFEEDKGMISIPVQGLNDYPLTNVTLNESVILFDMNIQGQKLTFDGKVEQEKMTGTFTQQGQTFPFELAKGSKEEEVEEDRLVEVQVEGGMMSGQLEVPAGQGPFPLMVIIAGSGPTDRNGNSIALPGKNNSLKMLAEDLAKEGVATIRYDKRGVGKNASLASKEEDLRFDHFIDDAAAWVQFAKNDARFSKIGIIGHSEGSLIGMVASQKADVDAFISIAGAGRPIDKVLLEQLQAQLPANLLQESTKTLEKLKQGEQVKTVSPELQSVFRSSVQPYMISWLQYDPTEQLQKLNKPILLVNGTLDIQVPVKDAELLHEAKKGSDLLIVDKMNHVLKEAPADLEGNIATYSNPDLPLAKGLIDGIVKFLQVYVK
ncbi:alpha/beta hydrolase [Psychrobacillus sp. NEAU-3TGS]|uniref:alpha/beta hydrolase family protein n=1 Tax=Psychrobacillus sp. NEAU-3TGS TaxID=2995412 RepID=UPI0024979F8F|nr:alpha/beta fold hydrolase [Psychrobacillus sp. NEAU-3TGS]MDI2587470.1 alpha/beta hydrolase [Psychrobacillus sp. NEAU-3TGS]